MIVSHCVENKPLTLLLSIVYFVKHEKGWIWKYAAIENTHTGGQGVHSELAAVAATRPGGQCVHSVLPLRRANVWTGHGLHEYERSRRAVETTAVWCE